MLPSIIRTFVPVVVGVIVGQAARIGFDLDAGAVTAIVTVVVATVYHAAVRWLETRWPGLGVLLGWAKAPSYRKRDVDLAA